MEFLDYFALGVLIFAAVFLFYGIIVVHDIPYDIAKHRNHPHQDAIHFAGWVSLLTLHILWPFLWIWATLYREDRGWGFSSASTIDYKRIDTLEKELADLKKQLADAKEDIEIASMDETIIDSNASDFDETKEEESDDKADDKGGES